VCFLRRVDGVIAGYGHDLVMPEVELCYGCQKVSAATVGRRSGSLLSWLWNAAYQLAVTVMVVVGHSNDCLVVKALISDGCCKWLI